MNVPHSTEKTTIALNFIRSANAPQISAGVMIKNMPWNSTCVIIGINATPVGSVNGSEGVTSLASFSKQGTPLEHQVIGIADVEQRFGGPVSQAVTAKAERIAIQKPDHAHDALQEHTLHDDAEDVFLADQATVEHRQAGDRHKQHERAAGQHPSIIRRIVRRLAGAAGAAGVSLAAGAAGVSAAAGVAVSG